MRVVTYNIQFGRGRDGRYADIDRTAQALDGADIVGLQEAEAYWDRSGNIHQVEHIAAALGGYHFVDGRTVDIHKTVDGVQRRRQFGGMRFVAVADSTPTPFSSRSSAAQRPFHSAWAHRGDDRRRHWVSYASTPAISRTCAPKNAYSTPSSRSRSIGALRALADGSGELRARRSRTTPGWTRRGTNPRCPPCHRARS